MSDNVRQGGFPPQFERRQRYRRGLNAESIVGAVYILSGHRILGRRFKTPAGEIDLIAVRRKRVTFVEVKRRQTQDEGEASVTPTLRRRVRRAADLWLTRNPQYQGFDIGFDLVFVLPWRFPIIMRDAL